MDGSPPRAAPPAAGALVGPSCSLDDSEVELRTGRTSSLGRGRAQVLQSPDSSALQARANSPSAGLASRKRKVCGHAPAGCRAAMSSGIRHVRCSRCWRVALCRAMHQGEGQPGTWQRWGHAPAGPCGQPWPSCRKCRLCKGARAFVLSGAAGTGRQPGRRIVQRGMQGVETPGQQLAGVHVDLIF